MAACKKHLNKILFIFLSAFIMISYQNCGKSVFRIDSLGRLQSSSSSSETIDVSCDSSAGCYSAGVPAAGGSSNLGSGGNSGGQPFNPNGNSKANNIKLTNGMPASLLNSRALENTNSDHIRELFYNYVADSKEQCEQAVEDSLGQKVTCKMAGGCGLGCGKPNSNCESANPDKWGACVSSLE